MKGEREMNVRWSRWNWNTGDVDKGVMEEREILPSMARRAKEAAEIMKRSEADHVLYGMTIYDGYRPVAVHFFMWPMGQKQFDQVARRCRCAMVYAIHRR